MDAVLDQKWPTGGLAWRPHAARKALSFHPVATPLTVLAAVVARISGLSFQLLLPAPAPRNTAMNRSLWHSAVGEPTADLC